MTAGGCAFSTVFRSFSDTVTTQASLADRAISLVRDAARANVEDPLLFGGLVELPAQGEVMVVGDLHGNLTNYEAVLQQADLAGAADRHLILQELVHEYGMKPGQPCRSWQLVEMVARLKSAYPDRVHVLFGNHEMSELCDLAIAKHGKDLNERFRMGVVAAYGDRAEDVVEAYREFWRTMPLAARTAHGLFVCHSTPRFIRMAPFSLAWFRDPVACARRVRKSPVFDLVWGRDLSQDAADEFARRVESELLLVGHTPCDNGFDSPNTRHIILDTKDVNGAYVLLPLDRSLTREDVLRRARRLFPGRQLSW